MCEACVDINAVVGREDGYNDYIRRGDLLAAYDKAHRGPPGGARKLIQEAPAEDVAPVVHGQWMISCDGYYPYCSACMAEPKNGEMSCFCPNCGAKMDGGADNG